MNILIWNRILCFFMYFNHLEHMMITGLLMLLKALYSMYIPSFCMFDQILLNMMCFLGFLAILAINYLAPKSSFVIFPFDVLIGLLIHFSTALSVQTSTTKEQLLGIDDYLNHFPFSKVVPTLSYKKS